MGVLPTDENLMEQYCAGSEAAFVELYGRYERKLFAFLERRLPTGRKHFAADLFQKTWLQLHAARRDFDLNRSFASWIFTIALNSLRDQVGKASFRLDVESEERGAELASNEDIEKSLLVRESLAQAEEILGTLSEMQREVLILSEWDGLSAREVGELFGISENSVRQALFRAKRKVKENRLKKEDV